MKILAAGGTIGRFTVEGVLGEGALAVVYRVRHKNLGTQHALKVLKVPHDVVVERLMNEGRAQATLQHENVVSVSDIVDIDGSPGLLMEYVEGTTLKDVLRHGRLSLRQAGSVGRGVLAGVSAAHRAGLIHRDLKPANILMAIRGKKMIPKITDFGLVKALGGDPGGSLETRTGIVLGTPHYMAPEQFDDARNVDQRADVFSVGVILYELATGQRPYTGSGLLDIMNAAMKGEYPPLEALAPDLPDGMRMAIESALRPERDERVGNCEVLYRMWTTSGSGSGTDESGALFETEAIAQIKQGAEASLEASIERLGKSAVKSPVASMRPKHDPEPPTEHDGQPPVGTDVPTERPSEVTENTDGLRPTPLVTGQTSFGDNGLPTEEMNRVVAATRGPGPGEASLHDPAESENRWMLPILALLLLLALGGGSVALLGAGAVAMFGGDLTGTAPPDPVPTLPDPPPEPVPEPTDVEREPADPQPGTQPSTAPDPAPAPHPAPQPAIRPDPLPAPDPLPSPDPVPVDVPTPAPPSGTGTVEVAGDHTSFVLVADDGRRVPPGEVDPGDYDIYAAFADAPVDKRGRIRVKAGEKLQLLCDGQVRYDCRVLQDR